METNEKTIYALGFFDGVHLGHQALLDACRRLAEETGCKAGVITFDTHPENRISGTGPQLLNTAEDRRRLLTRLGAEDIVTLPFDDNLRKMSWEDFVRFLSAEHQAAGFVCGDDFRFGYQGEGTAALLQEYCREMGLPCAVVPEQTVDGTRVSSTHIRELLAAGDLQNTNRFLGHDHILTGKVVSGRGLGRTIGVPTANLEVPENLLLPKRGVYACKAMFDGAVYPAVTNIGNRPTVGGHRVTVESWLLDFDRDLYGKDITLEFLRYLREEKQYPSLEQLAVEIRKNAEETREIFDKS